MECVEVMSRAEAVTRPVEILVGDPDVEPQEVEAAMDVAGESLLRQVVIPRENFPGLTLKIVAIEWERVWVALTLEFSAAPSGDVDFLIYDGMRAYPLSAVAESRTRYVARINVTNFRNRQQVPNGSWRFLSVIDGRRGPIASYRLARAAELDASGRSYLYNQNRSTYVVTFGLSADDRADVIMRTYQLNRPAPKQASPKRKDA